MTQTTVRGAPAQAHDTEVEWQFDAGDLDVARRWLEGVQGRTAGDGTPLSVRAERKRLNIDHYLDTDDWRLRRAGLVLRTRKKGDGVEATMKDVRPATSSGLRRRMELTEPLDVAAGAGGSAANGSAAGGSAANGSAAGSGATAGLPGLGSSGPVGSRLAAVAGSQPLGLILEVRTRRRPFTVLAGADEPVEVAEIALDDTILVAGKGQRPARLLRVEVEVAPDWVDALVPFVDDLRDAAGLAPATLSKFESGLLAAGVAMPAAPDLGPTDLGPGSTVGEVAYAVLRANVSQLLAREPGTRLGEDAEELHDMRVAIRRLRAAMSLFAASLPPRGRLLRDELRWMGHALGAVRDLDVQQAGFDDLDDWAASWPEESPLALDALRRITERQRESARHDLLGALDSPRWTQLSAGMVALVQAGPPAQAKAAHLGAFTALPALMDHRHRQAVRAAKVARRTGAAGDFHQLRIRCKRLRYAVECTGDLYGRDAKRFVKELTRLQDELGAHQDAEVAAARLAALARPAGRQRGRRMPAATVFALGSLAEHYRQRARALRADLPHHLAVLTGPSWKALASTMAEDRTHSLG